LRKGTQGIFPAGTKVVSKNLGNTKRLPEQHHDGIQSAIVHCKRSFN
jgi:hypothetical protein